MNSFLKAYILIKFNPYEFQMNHMDVLGKDLNIWNGQGTLSSHKRQTSNVKFFGLNMYGLSPILMAPH